MRVAQPRGQGSVWTGLEDTDCAASLAPALPGRQHPFLWPPHAPLPRLHHPGPPHPCPCTTPTHPCTCFTPGGPLLPGPCHLRTPTTLSLPPPGLAPPQRTAAPPCHALPCTPAPAPPWRPPHLCSSPAPLHLCPCSTPLTSSPCPCPATPLRPGAQKPPSDFPSQISWELSPGRHGMPGVPCEATELDCPFLGEGAARGCELLSGGLRGCPPTAVSGPKPDAEVERVRERPQTDGRGLPSSTWKPPSALAKGHRPPALASPASPDSSQGISCSSLWCLQGLCSLCEVPGTQSGH